MVRILFVVGSILAAIIAAYRFLPMAVANGIGFVVIGGIMAAGMYYERPLIEFVSAIVMGVWALAMLASWYYDADVKVLDDKFVDEVVDGEVVDGEWREVQND